MRTFLHITLFAFLGCLSLNAQKIPFHNYTVENGLPSNVVYDIEQDSKGYLWFGTQAGAVRFDGYNFVTYDVTSGLPGNMVKEIYIDNKDNIWVGTRNEGLAIITPSGIRTLSTTDGLLSNSIRSIFQDNLQNTWCITQEGISIIQPDTILNYHRKNSPFKNIVLDYYVAHNGQVFISSLDGLFTYDSVFTPFEYDELGYLKVYDIAEDKPGSYWFATENSGIVHYSSSTGIQIFNTHNGLQTDIAYTVAATDSFIVAGSFNGGIYQFINGKLQRSWFDEVKDYRILGTVIDNKNRVWCRTYDKGIVLITKNQLKTIREENQLVFDKPTKIFIDQNDNIWIATWNGISMYGKTIFEQYNSGLLYDDKNIISIEFSKHKVYLGTYSGYNIIDNYTDISNHVLYNLKDDPIGIYSLMAHNNDFWIGTNGGLIQISDGNVVPHFTNSMYTRNYPASAFDMTLSQNSIYVATQNGLMHYRNGKFQNISNPDDNMNGIYCLAIDSLQNIWCGSANGLTIYDGSDFHNYNISDGLPDNYCNDIVIDRWGEAWIATDNGISKTRLNNDWTIHCTNYGTQQGLTSGLALLITLDNNSNVWVGHNKGLDKFDPFTKQFTHYGKAEGFLPIETSMGAVSHGENGEIWFGTVDGAIRYLPENDYTYTDPPKAYITGIQLYGDSTSLNSMADSIDPTSNLPIKLRLDYNQNNLVFSYVGLHYTIVEKNTYKYILEGYDNQWSQITTDIITPPYRKLPHGKYTFKVRAANCDGIWTPSPAEFSFEIRPPFWKTIGFYILEGILGILLFWAIMYIRLRRLRAEKQRLTQKVKERTVEVEKQRDQIAHQKKEITDSIEYAERIQYAVLPSETFVKELLPESFVLFKPRDIVSGDFYWVNSEKDKVIVVAADCTGHGVPGAFMSMLGVSILNEIASLGKLPKANVILDTLRKHLTQTLQQTSDENDTKDGMDLCMIILDTKTRQLQFAGAYNPLILIRKQETTVFKGDKMPVGFHFGPMNPFSIQEITVEKGDCLYLFSDGYADQFGGPEGKKFKSAKLRELLCSISPLSMEEQKQKLNTTIEEWMAEEDQIDDMLIIGIRV